MAKGSAFMHNEVVKLPSYLTHTRGTVRLTHDVFYYGPEHEHYIPVALPTGEVVIVKAADLTKFPKHEDCPNCKCINIDPVT